MVLQKKNGLTLVWNRLKYKNRALFILYYLNNKVFDFELTQGDMEKISTLDTKESLFFSHRDPEMVKWLATFKIHD